MYICMYTHAYIIQDTVPLNTYLLNNMHIIYIYMYN